jgi:hypothetical protein
MPDGEPDGERFAETVQRLRGDHARIDEMFADLRDALADGEGEAAVKALFAELRAVLETHLAQEDLLYYPGLRGLRPEHRRMLDAFSAAHDEFRAELREISTAFGCTPAPELERRVDTMARRFVMHESGEELLLHRIDRELEGAPPPK